MLTFPDEAEPPIVYSDGLTGALYLDKPAEIDAYERIWSDIADASLNEGDSLRLIKTVAKELE